MPGGIPDAAAATQHSISYTSTHTIATLTAGIATFSIDFFSPVSPKNHLRQSLPFSYVTVTVLGTSAATPDVQIFTSIDDSWTGGQGNLKLDYLTQGTTSMFSLTDLTETYYVEKEDMAAWGSVVLATSNGKGSILSYQSGSTSSLYSAFTSHGNLNDQNPTYAAGNSMAFVHDLAKVSGSTSVNFAVGQYRWRVVKYLGQEQTGYHLSKYADALHAVDGFLTDYEPAYTESQSLDKQIQQASSAISNDYAALTSASVRQM